MNFNPLVRVLCAALLTVVTLLPARAVQGQVLTGGSLQKIGSDSDVQTFLVTGPSFSFVPQGNGLKVLALNLPATITNVAPNAVPFGGPNTILTILGTGFVTGAQVLWNGAPLATGFVSGTQLTAQLTTGASLVGSPATVTVVNPGAKASNTASVLVKQPAVLVFATLTRDPKTHQIRVTANFANIGGGYALNTALTQATLGGVAPLSPLLPTPGQNLNPGGNGLVALVFPATIAPGASTIKFAGTYMGGSFSILYPVSVP